MCFKRAVYVYLLSRTSKYGEVQNLQHAYIILVPCPDLHQLLRHFLHIAHVRFQEPRNFWHTVCISLLEFLWSPPQGSLVPSTKRKPPRVLYILITLSLGDFFRLLCISCDNVPHNRSIMATCLFCN